MMVAFCLRVRGWLCVSEIFENVIEERESACAPMQKQRLITNSQHIHLLALLISLRSVRCSVQAYHPHTDFQSNKGQKGSSLSTFVLLVRKTLMRVFDSLYSDDE